MISSTLDKRQPQNPSWPQRVAAIKKGWGVFFLKMLPKRIRLLILLEIISKIPAMFTQNQPMFTQFSAMFTQNFTMFTQIPAMFSQNLAMFS